jgi:predicted phage terminase large subunit-like protein
VTALLNPLDLAAERWAAGQALPHLHPRPGLLAAALTDGKEAQRAHLDLIDQALVDLRDGTHDRVMIFMPPQVGKSRRVSEWGPAWLLHHQPDWRIGVASYAAELARKRGRFVRNLLTLHPQLGLRVSPDSAAADRWDLADHAGGMRTVGVGGGLTGEPLHVAIIDDPVADRAAAQSQTIRDGIYDWYRDVLELRLQDVGGVVLMMTRWHEDDLAGRLLREEGERWHVLSVPALAEGPDDPLGRAPGEPIPHPRQSPEQYLERALRTKERNPRTFASLLQQRPAPDEGDLLLRAWWKTWTGQRWTEHDDGSRTIPDGAVLFTSWDMAFKDTKSSDYVVGQVWEHRGPDAYLLDQTRGRMSFTATLDAFVALRARWPQATAHLVEDKANGTAVLDSLRARVPGLVPITPTESKEARAAAVSPFLEGGNVYLPHPDVAPWALGLIEEAAAFPNAAHDDQVDAATQALARIYLGRQRRLRFRP